MKGKQRGTPHEQDFHQTDQSEAQRPAQDQFDRRAVAAHAQDGTHNAHFGSRTDLLRTLSRVFTEMQDSPDLIPPYLLPSCSW